MRLYTALVELLEARAERHREVVAGRFLNCGCGCEAYLGGTADD